jgi:hypothetical protein
VPPGTPFPAGVTDLQSWIRNSDLDPDWLRIGTDITHLGPFNAAFALSGDLEPVPEPATSGAPRWRDWDSRLAGGGARGTRKNPRGRPLQGSPSLSGQCRMQGQRIEFALSSFRFGSSSLHVANPEAVPPPATAAPALLCLAERRVGGRWRRHIRGTPGQKPYRNSDSNSLSYHGSPPVRLKPTEMAPRAHPRVPQSVRSPSPNRAPPHSIT